MNNQMAYLLGMIAGNGEIKRDRFDTTVGIDLPHKKLETEECCDVRIYVKASIADIRATLEPLLGAELKFTQQKRSSLLSFTKSNEEYLMREILRFVGSASSHEDIRLNEEVFSFKRDERISFLRGFADVTGYIRRSNYFISNRFMHRVYLEVPHNWNLVVDICNLLKSVDIPVQVIDWAHPNMRDGFLLKYKLGKPNFWKKEHQIKIWANEFEPIGFAVLHKREALRRFADELRCGLSSMEKEEAKVTHVFYWEKPVRKTKRPNHPGENDRSIPARIRGKHFDSWKEIASELGYPG